MLNKYLYQKDRISTNLIKIDNWNSISIFKKSKVYLR